MPSTEGSIENILQSLQEETGFIRKLLEKPESREALPPGED